MESRKWRFRTFKSSTLSVLSGEKSETSNALYYVNQTRTKSPKDHTIDIQTTQETRLIFVTKLDHTETET